MVKGFILLRLLPGLEADALNQIRSVPGVADLTLVFGGWDAVVQAEAKTLPALTRLVVGQIRGIHGVQATETLVATEI
jgi:DNA-binding Lrp family transcriptional regulator